MQDDVEVASTHVRNRRLERSSFQAQHFFFFVCATALETQIKHNHKKQGKSLRGQATRVHFVFPAIAFYLFPVTLANDQAGTDQYENSWREIVMGKPCDNWQRATRVYPAPAAHKEVARCGLCGVCVIFSKQLRKKSLSRSVSYPSPREIGSYWVS